MKFRQLWQPGDERPGVDDATARVGGQARKASEVCNMTTDVILGLAALWLLLTIAYIVRRRRRADRRAP